MKGTIKLFQVAGIPVLMHWSFGLILLLVLMEARRNDLSFSGTLWLLMLFLILFSCVVLHEFGHALTARRYQVNTRDIILSPIGGIARLERIPDKAWQELWIALAGPAVNLLIAGTLYLILQLAHLPVTLQADSETLMLNRYTILPYVLTMNIFLALFNLLPAFPMDGGRVLRSLMALFMRRWKATFVASWVGRLFALVFLGFGLYWGEWVLAFIGLFIFINAGLEYRSTRIEEMLQAQTIEDRMNRDIIRVDSSLTFSMVENLFDNHAVLYLEDPEDNITHYVITREIQGKAIPPQTPLLHVAHPIGHPLNDQLSLEIAYQIMQQRRLMAIPVAHEGFISGSLLWADMEKMMRRASLFRWHA
ncbi:MAG: site-2 protease family protein [Saprospiraceae bacterium]|nr:site-2 protease family protein [Saprospiraceae bacterium]